MDISGSIRSRLHFLLVPKRKLPLTRKEKHSLSMLEFQEGNLEDHFAVFAGKLPNEKRGHEIWEHGTCTL